MKLKFEIRAIMLRVNVTLFILHSFPFFNPLCLWCMLLSLKKICQLNTEIRTSIKIEFFYSKGAKEDTRPFIISKLQSTRDFGIIYLII